jgi:glycosyltransferase involved in cell wall biosynthesis
VIVQEKTFARPQPVSAPASIFARYYTSEAFVDRFSERPDDAIDVIIPVLNANELWEKNLISIYREIPVNRLLIGNGGCADETIAIARKFPRVEVYDHLSSKTLGYSVKELIKAVETEWFAYLHADVYLPDGWFEVMRGHQGEFDWFGCPMRLTVMMDYLHHHPHRPYAGSQMGRRAAFDGLDRIDDDYVYRQEDFVFARVVEDGGFRHGKVEDTFHYHQVMPLLYGAGERARKLKSVDFAVETTPAEELHTAETQFRGTIKYLRPDGFQIRAVQANVLKLKELGKFDFDERIAWVGRTNPEWLPHIPPPAARVHRYRTIARSGLKAMLRHGLEYLLHKLG